ncbi:ArsR/SmtB family transcription factor [Streptomyces sp. T028]|uniref:ArsR/SmtB family transcription factor n=1 Tax=Streptomyces sp. T028 TaxID=3394379 RepID=UPI003A886A23
MDSGNRPGDVEPTDPKAMRALAHPVRLAVLERLQRYGPATASQLSPHVGATPSVTSWHLRHLAGFGLVRDAQAGTDRRERRWEAVGPGFRVGEPEWEVRADGLNTRIVVTPEELAGLREAVEELLAPYVTREADRWPPGSRSVRVITYTLPEGAAE